MTESLKVRGFQIFDSDSNGKISKAEINQRLAGIVKRFDRNGDGVFLIEDRRLWHRSHDHDDDDDDAENNPPLSKASGGASTPRVFLKGLRSQRFLRYCAYYHE